jgi:hypothetical protein
VKSSPDPAPPDDAADARVYQAFLEPLKDQFLLSIRDGSWRRVSDLALWLAPRVKPEVAVQRFLASGGTHEKKLSDKIGQGQALVLQDLIDSLRRNKLLAARAPKAGEEEIQVTPLEDPRFDIDPELEFLLPRSPDEVKKLEDRLLVEQPRDALVVWKGHRMLVDGHTRYRFYALLGRKFEVVELDFPDRAAVIAWLYDTHYGRRSYSAEMKSYVRGKSYLGRKQPHGGSRKKARGQSVLLRTADAVGAEYGVDGRTVKRDAAFTEALDQIAAACGAEVRDQVLSRVARWTRRDVERLAKLAKATLQETVRAALKSGKRPKVPALVDEKKGIRKSLSIPMGRPKEQVRVLRRVLGGRAANLLTRGT